MANNTINNRAKIQELIHSNTARAGGDFHSDELDCESFISDLQNNFKLIPKEEDKETYELLNKIIELSTVKVRGMFNSKELKQSKFLKEMFNKFEINKL